MGFSYSGASTTAAHEHSTAASDGGQLSLSVTRITGFSPMSLAVSMN